MNPFLSRLVGCSAGPSDVAAKVAEEFENGTILRSRLDAQGISTMAIRYSGSVIEASWYDQSLGYKLRHVSIDSISSFGASVDAEHIKNAAIRRAERMLADKIDSLRDRKPE